MSGSARTRGHEDVRDAPHAVLELAVMVGSTRGKSMAKETVLLPLDKAEARMLSGQVEALRGIKPFSALTMGDDLVVGLRVRVGEVRLVGEDEVVTDDAPAPASDPRRPSKEAADAGVSTDREALADSISDWMGGE